MIELPRGLLAFGATVVLLVMGAIIGRTNPRAITAFFLGVVVTLLVLTIVLNLGGWEFSFKFERIDD